MSDQFLGEIRMVGFDFAPRGWFTCQGQQVAISQFQALFALLGTTFGGNGVTTFGMPDLQGRAPLGQGNGLGLPAYVWGEKAGVASATLNSTQLPVHAHAAAFAGSGGGTAPVTIAVQGSSVAGNASNPGGNYRAGQTGSGRAASNLYVTPDQAGTPVAINGGSGGSVAIPTAAGTVTTQNAGGSQPIAMQPPFVCLCFIIAYNGIFPSRN